MRKIRKKIEENIDNLSKMKIKIDNTSSQISNVSTDEENNEGR